MSRICPFCGRILLDQRLIINDLAVAAGGENAAKLLNLTVPLGGLVPGRWTSGTNAPLHRLRQLRLRAGNGRRRARHRTRLAAFHRAVHRHRCAARARRPPRRIRQPLLRRAHRQGANKSRRPQVPAVPQAVSGVSLCANDPEFPSLNGSFQMVVALDAKVERRAQKDREEDRLALWQAVLVVGTVAIVLGFLGNILREGAVRDLDALGAWWGS